MIKCELRYCAQVCCADNWVLKQVGEDYYRKKKKANQQGSIGKVGKLLN